MGFSSGMQAGSGFSGTIGDHGVTGEVMCVHTQATGSKTEEPLLAVQQVPSQIPAGAPQRRPDGK